MPQGTFLNDTLQQQKTIVNCMAINQDNVMVTGGDNGSLWCALRMLREGQGQIKMHPGSGSRGWDKKRFSSP